MPKNDYTEIVVLLDTSGSMHSIRADMCGAFNAFIADQKIIPGECTVTLATFNNDYSLAYRSKPLSEVSPLSFSPGGSTALNDALVKTIDDAGEHLNKLAEDAKPDKVMFIVITDGEENASKKYDVNDVKTRIEHQANVYNWAFLYFGANQDAVLTAKGYGISNSSDYSADSSGVARAGTRMSDSTRSYRTTGNNKGLITP